MLGLSYANEPLVRPFWQVQLNFGTFVNSLTRLWGCVVERAACKPPHFTTTSSTPVPPPANHPPPTTGTRVGNQVGNIRPPCCLIGLHHCSYTQRKSGTFFNITQDQLEINLSSILLWTSLARTVSLPLSSKQVARRNTATPRPEQAELFTPRLIESSPRAPVPPLLPC